MSARRSPTAHRAIERTLRHVVELFVRRDYAGLEQLSGGVRLKAAEIAGGISQYGRTLVMPPPEAFERLDVIPIRRTSPKEYAIRFRFYTLEEGLSDLEFQATLVTDPASALMKVELDGVLVA